MAKKYSNDFIQKVVEEDTNHEYILVDLDRIGALHPKTGKRTSRKMRIKHSCGHEYEVHVSEFIHGKRRCGKCKGEKLRKHFAQTLKSVQEEVEQITNGEYSFVDEEFINSKHKHKFKHNTCKTVFDKKLEKFKAGQRCPKCTRKGMESSASRYIRDVLDHFNIAYEKEKRFDDCVNKETGRVLPFDYFLPDINTLIEIDGEQHERGSFKRNELKGIQERDLAKNLYAQEKGLRLIRIPAKKWSQLPEILHSILSECFIPDLSLEAIKDIPPSSHVDRINKDLAKLHNGAYRLYDPYYFGVDRKHLFMHIPCGHVFQSTLYLVKKYACPCPDCRSKIKLKKSHKKISARLETISNGRYSLDPSNIYLDTKGRRLTKCHQCNKSWWVTPGNLTGGKAGCPNCQLIEKEKAWVQKLNEINKTLKNHKELSIAQLKWLDYYRRQYHKKMLKTRRLELLKKSNLI